MCRGRGIKNGCSIVIVLCAELESCFAGENISLVHPVVLCREYSSKFLFPPLSHNPRKNPKDPIPVSFLVHQRPSQN